MFYRQLIVVSLETRESSVKLDFFTRRQGIKSRSMFYQSLTTIPSRVKEINIWVHFSNFSIISPTFKFGVCKNAEFTYELKRASYSGEKKLQIQKS